MGAHAMLARFGVHVDDGHEAFGAPHSPVACFALVTQEAHELGALDGCCVLTPVAMHCQHSG